MRQGVQVIFHHSFIRDTSPYLRCLCLAKVIITFSSHFTHTHTDTDILPSPKCSHPRGIRHRLSLLFQSRFGTFELQLKGSHCHAQGSSAVTKEIWRINGSWGPTSLLPYSAVLSTPFSLPPKPSSHTLTLLSSHLCPILSKFTNFFIFLLVLFYSFFPTLFFICSPEICSCNWLVYYFLFYFIIWLWWIKMACVAGLLHFFLHFSQFYFLIFYYDY